ncbi:kinase-like domain-containing protein, partial [Vararia minispora EC-137]
AEAAAVRFVRAHTRIPVPRVWAVVPWFGDYYLLMRRVRGIELTAVWPTLDSTVRERITTQVRGFIDQLRALRSPFGERICSATGGRVHDPRLPARHRGPFANEEAFNYVLRYFEPLANLPASVQEAHALVHAVVFTHGDVLPRNVMVDAAQPERVLALLDWDAAGWFPAHWEYRKARWTAESGLENSWVSRIVQPYVFEADADDYLARRFWAPG